MLNQTEVTALDGDSELRQITLTHCVTGQSRVISTHWLFVCIGGEPQTQWAAEVGIVRDAAGYLVTGPDLLRECEMLGGCATGDAKITRGYRLQARHVIHTVGPVWYGGARDEVRLLASCYRRSLECAREALVRSIAFPAISCGVYRFPADDAVVIATRTVVDLLPDHPELEYIVFACFDDAMHARYERELAALAGRP